MTIQFFKFYSIKLYFKPILNPTYIKSLNKINDIGIKIPKPYLYPRIFPKIEFLKFIFKILSILGLLEIL